MKIKKSWISAGAVLMATVPLIGQVGTPTATNAHPSQPTSGQIIAQVHQARDEVTQNLATLKQQIPGFVFETINTSNNLGASYEVYTNIPIFNADKKFDRCLEINIAHNFNVIQGTINADVDFTNEKKQYYFYAPLNKSGMNTLLSYIRRAAQQKLANNRVVQKHLKIINQVCAPS